METLSDRQTDRLLYLLHHSQRQHQASNQLLTLWRHKKINTFQHIKIEFITPIFDAFSPPANLPRDLRRYLARLLASLTTFTHRRHTAGQGVKTQRPGHTINGLQKYIECDKMNMSVQKFVELVQHMHTCVILPELIGMHSQTE